MQNEQPQSQVPKPRYVSNIVNASRIRLTQGYYVDSYVPMRLRSIIPYNDANIDKRIAGTLNTNRAFHGWGHQFLYTQEMLGYLLSELGFEEVSFHSYGESNDPELSNLERHGKPRVDESNPNVIIAEARRGDSEIGPSTSLASFLNQKFLAEAGNRIRVDNSR